LFLKLLGEAPSANSAQTALDLLGKILNQVEDAHSGVKNNPDAWKSDGRMYPPKEDNRRKVLDHPSLRRYRSARHNTFIGLNGSIRIETLAAEILLDKPGRDGRKARELDV
jgi:hypothetical protein